MRHDPDIVCERCLHFDPYHNPAAKPDVSGGLCRCNAPAVTPIDPIDDRWSQVHARWPHVRATDWCGEFQHNYLDEDAENSQASDMSP